MTQGPQQPEHQGPPPAMYPPVPGPPRRSSKTALIVVAVVAVVIALVAVAALAFTLSRPDGDVNSAVTAAAPSSSVASATDGYRLRGSLKSKASVCVTAAFTTNGMPKFEAPLDYSRPTLDSDISKARQDLSRLASRISPDAAEPMRSTVQDWIISFADLLDAFAKREPDSEVKPKRELADGLAGRMNETCKTN